MLRFALFVLSPALAFSANLLAVKVYGEPAFGAMSFIISLSLPVCALLFSGYGNMIARSGATGNCETGTVTEFTKAIANTQTTLLALIFCLCFYAFCDPERGTFMLAFSLSVVSSRILGAFFRGREQPIASLAVEPFSRSLALFGAASLAAMGYASVDILWQHTGFLLSHLAILSGLAAHQLKRRNSSTWLGKQIFYYDIFASSLSISLIGMTLVWVANIDSIMIGLIAGESEITDYRLASQVCAFLPIVQILFNHSRVIRFRDFDNMPMEARLDAEIMMQRNSHSATLTAILLSIAGFVFFAIRPIGIEVDLVVYGVLACTSIVNCAFGSAGAILLANKKEASMLRNYFRCLAANAILNATLIPFLGTLGACISTFVTVTAMNFGNTMNAKRLLNISTCFLFPNGLH